MHHGPRDGILPNGLANGQYFQQPTVRPALRGNKNRKKAAKTGGGWKKLREPGIYYGGGMKMKVTMVGKIKESEDHMHNAYDS